MRGTIRLLLTSVILTSILGWIVLSYIPAARSVLPQFRYSSTDALWIYPPLILGLFVAFFALQVWLVASTAGSIRRYRNGERSHRGGVFDLSVGREAFLTALPIGFTVLLALAAVFWWQNLATGF